MRREHIIIVASVVAVVAIGLIFAGIVFFQFFPKMKKGYTRMAGFLELRSYPKLSEVVPTVI